MSSINYTEIEKIYDQPLLELISQAHQVHLQSHPFPAIQLCTLVSIKTGGCPEDCRYCPQSSHYQTVVKAQPLMDQEIVMQLAKEAIKRGSTRVCLGAAWREVKDNHAFEKVISMIQSISAFGVEVCCTLGFLTFNQAQRLKQAGLYAYNHNLDSSEKFYQTIITTRTYQQRLQTLSIAADAGLHICCGGILGMGETKEDRLQLLQTLKNLKTVPQSIPLNCLVAIAGTPLEKQPPLSIWEFVRMVATTRILFPKTMIRLSAGRDQFSEEHHALCFLAGANSIFSGDKLLTINNVFLNQDTHLFNLLGLKKLKEKTLNANV